MREREKEEREINRSKEIGKKREKGEVVHRKEGTGEAERDKKKRETEKGRRGYMKIDKELPQRFLVCE